MTGLREARPAVHQFVHQACVYGSEGEFLATAVPFLAEGVARGEPVLAATTPANLALLRTALGTTGIDYVSSGDFGPRPSLRVAAFHRYWAHRAVPTTGRQVRVLAESVWSGRSPREVAAWTVMESGLNVVLGAANLRMVCSYDARTVPEPIVADADCTHPELISGQTARPSPRYVDPGEFARRRDGEPLPPPPADAATISVTGDIGDLRTLRRFVAEQVTARTGMWLEMVVLAVSEATTHLVQQSAGPCTVWTWAVPGALMFEVSAGAGSRLDPFLGLWPPRLDVPPDGADSDGLWLARQVCEFVDVRATVSGTIVRMEVPGVPTVVAN